MAPPPCVRPQAPLAAHTTLAVGGLAAHLASPQDLDQARQALRWAQQQGLPVFVMGGGSNLLVSDAGFPGMVLRWEPGQIQILREEGPRVLVQADAGVPWDELVAWAVERDLAGLTCLSGIPGQVGAAPIQNIGAYGQEVGDCLHAVTALRLEDHSLHTLSREDCGLSYRHSHFKGTWRGQYLVSGVQLWLTRGASPELRYAELQRRAQALGEGFTLGQLRQLVLEIRREKSMVYDPADPNHRSAGSFFMNPILPLAQAQDIADHWDPEDAPPIWPVGEDQAKLPAAWLIERAGFSKGYTLGQAALSSKHCLALINRGQASADELVALALQIQRGVHQRFGVTLRPEARLVGFGEDPAARALLSGDPSC